MKLLVVLALLLALAAPAQATTVAQEPVTTVIVVSGDGEEANDIVVVRGGVVRIRDEGAQVHLDESAAALCLVIDAHEVSCPADRSIRVLAGAGADRFEASGNLDRLDADLGPGEDTADVSGMLVRGGDGADRLVGNMLQGGPGDDRLETDPERGGVAFGDGGDDALIGTERGVRLVGGPGRDRLEGRGGDDSLEDFEAGGGEGADVYDGGAGRDTLSYDPDIAGLGRSEGVHLDLVAGTGGAPREGDRLVGIEDAKGTDSADVLEGGPGDEVLDGSDGPDVVDGRGGPDFLEGGRGADRLVGGDGNDRLSGGFDDDVLAGDGGDDVLVDERGRDALLGGDGQDRLDGGVAADTVDGGAGQDSVHAEGDYAADAVRCGPGPDTVTVDAADLTDADCEGVQRVPSAPFLKPVGRKAPARGWVRGRKAFVTIACLYGPVLRTDTGVVVLFLGGREIGRAAWTCVNENVRFPRDPRGFMSVVVPLTKAGAKRVHRDREVRAVAMLHFEIPDQAVVKERLRLRLAPPA